jgi:hypothetical protein
MTKTEKKFLKAISYRGSAMLQEARAASYNRIRRRERAFSPKLLHSFREAMLQEARAASYNRIRRREKEEHS